MARKPRLHADGALYHVMLRGNGGTDIFHHDDDRRRFEALVAEGVKRFEHLIHAYCWMTNHVHLAIQVGAIPLSTIIQNMAFRYARWLNRRQGRFGQVFQGRYKAILRARARQMVAHLTLSTRSATLTEVARRVRRDAATLSNGLRRFEARLSRDPVLRERVRALRERILRGEQGGAPPFPAGNDPPS